MADLTCEMKEFPQASAFLQKAEEIAQRIHSTEHLAEIYRLYYRIYESQGNYQKALKYHVHSVALQDSVVNINSINEAQNTSLGIERKRQAEELNAAHKLYEAEMSAKNLAYTIFAILLLFALTVVALMYYTLRIRANSHRILQQQSKMRETFFTNITHEFRTPLTLILGLSHNIHSNQELPEKIQEMGGTIERQGNNLLKLINQLLYISKVKSEVGEPDWRHGNISAYIGMIMEEYNEYASERGINLLYQNFATIHMDFVPDYVNKVLNNLLSNAFKFTPEGGTIIVCLEKDNDAIRIQVSDTGMGIAEEDLPQLFEPFIQGKNNSKQGTGVGLALVRQIITSVEGTIKVESIIDKGTTFTMHIPMRHGNSHWEIFKLEDYHNEIEKPTLQVKPRKTVTFYSNHIEEYADNRLHLLIVEDNSDVADYIGSKLSEQYHVSYAANGKEGLAKAHEQVPDLIITDLMMPEMDGLEMCRSIRADEVISHVPIIIVTARVTETDRIKGLEAGADAYLSKPFNEDELQVRVEKLLEQRRLLREKFSNALIEHISKADSGLKSEETATELESTCIEAQQSIVVSQTMSEDATPENKNLSDDEKWRQKEEADKLLYSYSDLDSKFLDKVVISTYELMEKKEANVNNLASELCMSTRQFQRKIAAITGETPSTYIMQIRIKRAKELFKQEPELTINQVADMCGFEEASNFSRTFKKFCSITPTQYINKIREH